MVAVVALATVLAADAPAGAKKSSSANKKTLATLKIQSPHVTVKKKGKSRFSAAKDGQALRQGDSIKTDTAGKAEIDYTDGSLTRLGNSTEFKISKLTNKKGGRQTQGTLSVGETWNRAAKVSETGSFEVKAGGTTAAVEGTAFAVVCTKEGTTLTCTFTDVVDTVRVTSPAGTVAKLGPATSVVVTQGNLGAVNQLTYDQLGSNLFIVGNLALDLQAGKGKGFGDLPAVSSQAAGDQTGGAGGNGGGGNGGQPTAAATETPTPGAGQYPPTGAIVIVNPNISVEGEVAFRGSGCAVNEQLAVLFDGKSMSTIMSDPQGNFSGSLTVPAGTAPGTHMLTVRGAVCVLNATVTVAGNLAFTGSSSHTSTYVLVGAAAIVLGGVLVVGTRRRRVIARHKAPRSSA